MRPTGSPSRSAMKYSASPCSNQGFFERSRNCMRSKISGGTHCGWSLLSRKGTLTKRFSCRLVRTGTIFVLGTAENLQRLGKCHTPGVAETSRSPADVFEKARTHDRLEQLEAARENDLLPYFRLLTSQAGPVVEMEGRGANKPRPHNHLRPARAQGGKEGAPR